MGGDGWGSPLAEIDFEDSVSDTTRVSDATLVRLGTPPRGKRDFLNNEKMTINTYVQ